MLALQGDHEDVMQFLTSWRNPINFPLRFRNILQVSGV